METYDTDFPLLSASPPPHIYVKHILWGWLYSIFLLYVNENRVWQHILTYETERWKMCKCSNLSRSILQPQKGSLFHTSTSSPSSAAAVGFLCKLAEKSCQPNLQCWIMSAISFTPELCGFAFVTISLSFPTNFSVYTYVRALVLSRAGSLLSAAKIENLHVKTINKRRLTNKSLPPLSFSCFPTLQTAFHPDNCLCLPHRMTSDN